MTKDNLCDFIFSQPNRFQEVEILQDFDQVRKQQYTDGNFKRRSFYKGFYKAINHYDYEIVPDIRPHYTVTNIQGYQYLHNKENDSKKQVSDITFFAQNIVR